jgi:hypothetical protein
MSGIDSGMGRVGASGADAADTSAADAQATSGTDAAPGASVVRGAGQALPASVQTAVLSFDRQNHASRNMPDRSYGPVVVSSSRNHDGSWNVQVGTMPTTLFGPRPGQKPFDIVTYRCDSDGSVSVGGATSTGGGVTETGDGYAEDVEQNLDNGNSRGAVESAVTAGKNLVRAGLGFPSMNPNPDPADVESFKQMLSDLESDNRIDDLAKAAVKEEARQIAGFPGGRRPMDWYGSREVLDALVRKYGTPSQQSTWKTAETAQTETGGLQNGGDMAKLAEACLDGGDNAGATRAALSAGGHLTLPGMGFPHVNPNPAPADLKRFQDFLGQLGKDGKLGDLHDAVAAQDKKEHDALTGGENRPIPDWYGPMSVMDALVSKFGDDSQKQAWGLDAGTPASGPTGGGGTQKPWADQVKDFFVSELGQGELGNDLEAVDRKDLPKAAQKAFDQYNKDYGPDFPPTAYKIDEVGGKTAFAIVDQTDGGTYAELYDAKGKKIASGSGGESEDFSWN